jgi:hypothetical protein
MEIGFTSYLPLQLRELGLKEILGSRNRFNTKLCDMRDLVLCMRRNHVLPLPPLAGYDREAPPADLKNSLRKDNHPQKSHSKAQPDEFLPRASEISPGNL